MATRMCLFSFTNSPAESFSLKSEVQVLGPSGNSTTASTSNATALAYHNISLPVVKERSRCGPFLVAGVFHCQPATRSFGQLSRNSAGRPEPNDYQAILAYSTASLSVVWSILPFLLGLFRIRKGLFGIRFHAY